MACPGFVADALPDEFRQRATHRCLDGPAWRGQTGGHRARPIQLWRTWANAVSVHWNFVRAKVPAKESAQAAGNEKSLVETARKVMQGDFSEQRHARPSRAGQHHPGGNICRRGAGQGGDRMESRPRAGNPQPSGQFDLADGFEHWLTRNSTAWATGSTNSAPPPIMAASGICLSPHGDLPGRNTSCPRAGCWRKTD